MVVLSLRHLSNVFICHVFQPRSEPTSPGPSPRPGSSARDPDLTRVVQRPPRLRPHPLRNPSPTRSAPPPLTADPRAFTKIRALLQIYVIFVRRTGRGFPALAGDGSGTGIRYRTRGGYGAGTVVRLLLLGLRLNRHLRFDSACRGIYNGFLLYNRHLLLQSRSPQTIGISFSNRHLDSRRSFSNQSRPWMKFIFHRKTPTPSHLLLLILETYDQIPQPTQPSAHAATQAVGTAAEQADGGTSTAQVAGAGPSAAQVAGAGPSAAQADAQPVGTAEAQDIGTNRKLTSVVWNHFKREKIDGEWKAICNYCRKKLSGKDSHGTTHLHDHYKACMPRKTKDIRQSILNPRQQKKDGPVSLGAYTFDQNVSRAELAEMVILHEYPLNMVEHFGFRMTTDMWTASNQKRGYMVVTAHYIDDSFVLCNKVLRFMYVLSVASESAFSTAGRHITPHRNRLHPDLVEILICTQDWLWDDNLGKVHTQINKITLASLKLSKMRTRVRVMWILILSYEDLMMNGDRWKWVPVGFPIPGGDYFTRTRRGFGGAGAGMGLGSEVGDGDGYCSPRPHPSPFASLIVTCVDQSTAVFFSIFRLKLHRLPLVR
ncbi:hypothetical protein LXL04_021739 [Taraxacum kok-saghyz]